MTQMDKQSASRVKVIGPACSFRQTAQQPIQLFGLLSIFSYTKGTICSGSSQSSYLIVANRLIIAACGTKPWVIKKGIADSPSQLTLQNAQGIAGQFFSEWESSDYAAMYTFIGPNSRVLHAQDDFEDQYLVVSDQLRLDSV